MVRIIDLDPDDAGRAAELATLLVDGFAGTGSASWQTQDEALETVRASLGADRLSRVALDAEGRVTGWIGGVSMYDGRVWELHPLVVRRDVRGQGIGRALVADFEEAVRRRGGLTVYLGTDDENGRTSLGGVDLYPDALGAAARAASLDRHPLEFYRRLGYTIVGVLPDANGFGKPDIFMAKRVAAAPAGLRPAVPDA